MKIIFLDIRPHLKWCFSLLLLWFVQALPLSAQTKYESEQRICRDEVPPPAWMFVDSLTDSKVKWYLETGWSSVTYEAKFKKNDHAFSVEFDSCGQIEDIEIVIIKKELPGPALALMEKHLDSAFHRFRFGKIQVQYIGSPHRLLQLPEVHPDLVVRYEIELKAKTKGERPRMYEYTFDRNGAYLFREIIVFRNADHLEY